MKTYRALAIAIVLAVMVLILQSPTTVAAQDQDYDPPSRVARLNYSNGSVSFQPGGEGDWLSADVNRPMTTGDNLWADQNSRAELHVGSTAIRMNSETSLTFLDLDDRTTQLRLSMGTLILRVRHLDDGDLFEVDTPNLAFQIQRIGEYRIDVNADGNETITTVWHGRGEVTGGGESYTVVAGQAARFAGTDQLDHEIEQIPGSDNFANWAFSRDQREDHDESSNYVSPEMTGYEDLDDYGHWRYVADYGPVWAPTAVPAGWAPYRFGHWVWVDPWGWTWVEDEPWGFAPFHYGRWAFVQSSWCWVPGPVVVRPVYAPALVAFVGGGGFSVSLAVGGAGVAWFPLGPREVYVPPYRVSRGYVNNVNITNTRVNITQVTNVYNNYTTNNVTKITYVNQRVPSGVTAVSHDTFVNSRPVARNLGQVDANKIAQGPVMHGPQVQPVRQSVLGASAPARVKPPAAVENRRVVATRTPTQPRPSFEQRKPTVNVRTEQPSQPQPAGRGTPAAARGGENPRAPEPAARGNEAPRPGQPAARGSENPRPEQPAGRGNENPRTAEPKPRDNEPPRPGQPAANAGPESKQVPRPPQAGRPQEQQAPSRPEQANRPEERQAPQAQQREDNGRPNNPPHPLVKQAPPAQERPQQQQNEEEKFRQWQQQRQNVPRPQANRPPEQQQERPQQKQEKPDKQQKDKPDKQKDNPEPKRN